MQIIPQDRLVALGVVNNGVGKTTWAIESAPQGLYMKGQRDTAFGYQKLIIMCGRRSKLEVMAVFDPQGRQATVAAMSAVSLMINDKQVMVPTDRLLMKPKDNNGWINVIVAVDDALIPQFETARTIGVAVQFTYQAAVFAGIRDMDFTKGGQMLPGFLASCH
jgi:hypothetical protein